MSREHLETLTEIRSLMERSSKFFSLSGLSGVSAGIIALIGAGAAYVRFQKDDLLAAYNQPSVLSSDDLYQHVGTMTGTERYEAVQFVVLDGVLVLIAALAAGIFFTVRKARRQGMSVWNPTSRRLLWAMAVPLVAGGILCLSLIHYNLIWLVFPSTLIFYGLALFNGSKYTVRDVEYLGLSEIALGLLALFLSGYTLLTWAIGFGLLHIVYGTVMYYKYDKSL